MNNYALIENGTVTNITLWDGVSPVSFGDGITAVEATADVAIGYSYDGSNFTAPVVTVPVPTQAEVIASFTAAIQGVLDAYAQSWGYDNIVSAASYASSTVDKFKNEAVALLTWRDQTWAFAEGFEADVEAGKATMPATLADFIAQLPATPARPS